MNISIYSKYFAIGGIPQFYFLHSDAKKMEMFLNINEHDCWLMVGKGDEIKKFTCYRDLLSSSSEVFQAMLNGDFKESKSFQVVDLPDEDSETFGAFLNFVYFDKIDCAHLKLSCSPVICHGLLRMSDKYMIPELHKQTIEFMKNNINEFNLLDVFEIAHSVEDAGLIDICTKVI